LTSKVTDSKSALQTAVVKLRLETDFNAFIANNSIEDTLSAVADALGILRGDIALLDVRSGCVILVVSLPEEAAQRLLAIGSSSSENDDLRDLATNLHISKIIAGDAIGAAELLRLDSVPFNADLCWLHLSDLHITSDYRNPRSDVHADLNRFLEDLPKRLGDLDLAPDVTFFTGDVVQSGTEEEYEVAEEFFATLQQVLPASSRFAPVLIVPGNHDVTWSAIDVKREIELREELKSSSDPMGVLQTHAGYIGDRQRNYRKFIEKLNGTLDIPPLDGLSFTYSFSAPSRGVHVGVAGFNSSWLSTRKDLHTKARKNYKSLPDLDLQNLRLGSDQLRDVTTSTHFSKSNIRIALMHHEPLSEWYAESDKLIQRQELSRYDFVLRGHQHETCARVGAKIAGSDDFIELAPGALRTQPHWYQGFMTTELDFRRGMIRLRTWSVSGHVRRWLPDAEFGNGGMEFRPLPERLQHLH
jgi:predicted phosphodiesterase